MILSSGDEHERLQKATAATTKRQDADVAGARAEAAASETVIAELKQNQEGLLERVKRLTDELASRDTEHDRSLGIISSKFDSVGVQV